MVPKVSQHRDESVTGKELHLVVLFPPLCREYNRRVRPHSDDVG